MSDLAIRVEELAKLYRLGGTGARYGRLTETLTDAVKKPFRKRERQERGQNRDSIWALKDVSFDVRPGQAVGIIGRNGAGKSTLLKILSRITEPTKGQATIYGRVGSLLEVGTGFHPELTGRENISLNGAILGMGRVEIREKLDAIVAFAEIDDFLDTPVKRYSSGMQVRLAFAVAAHLEPDILIVDEVLAVGDIAFQKKCIGKMGDVAGAGRTVLFVSHNMGVVSRLCEHGIWLEKGMVKAEGPMGEVVNKYLLTASGGSAEFVAPDPDSGPGNESIRLRAVRLRNAGGDTASLFDAEQPIYVEIEYTIYKPAFSTRTGFQLVSGDGTVIFTASDIDDLDPNHLDRPAGTYVSSCEIPAHLLRSGQYALTVSSTVPNRRVNFSLDSLVTFSVESHDESLEAKRLGVVAPNLPWRVELLQSLSGKRD